MQGAYISSEPDAEFEARAAEQLAAREHARAKLALRTDPKLAAPQPTPDVDLAASLERAEADLAEAEMQLGKLSAAVEKATEAAAAARSKFEDDPTEKLAATLMVADQKLANAKKAAFMHKETVVLQAELACQHARDDIEREALRAELQWSRAEAPMHRIRDAILALARTLDEAIPETAAVIQTWRDAAPRAVALGLQAHMSGLEDMLARVQAEIGAQLGGNAYEHSIDLVGTSDAVAAIRVVLSRPAANVKHLAQARR